MKVHINNAIGKVSLISFSLSILFACLSCAEKSEIKIDSHKISWGKSDKRVGIMIDESSDKAIKLIDCENDGIIDFVKVIDQANRKFTTIFEQNGETIIMITDMTNKDGQLWTARLLIGNDLYECHRGKGMQWEFLGKKGEMRYVHLGDVKGGHVVDEIPEVK